MIVLCNSIDIHIFELYNKPQRMRFFVIFIMISIYMYTYQNQVSWFW